jgi:hypothetical protein
MARGSGAAFATLALLAFAGPTEAATPQQTSQQIFRDLADNGRLDGHYTRRQIDRALRSPSLRRYELDSSPSRSEPVPAAAPPAAADDRRSLPFSGIDLALLGGVGAPLLLIGASLGRLTRFRAGGELN